jgi:hypothetical protein
MEWAALHFAPRLENIHRTKWLVRTSLKGELWPLPDFIVGTASLPELTVRNMPGAHPFAGFAEGWDRNYFEAANTGTVSGPTYPRRSGDLVIGTSGDRKKQTQLPSCQPRNGWRWLQLQVRSGVHCRRVDAVSLLASAIFYPTLSQQQRKDGAPAFSKISLSYFAIDSHL